MRLAGSGSRVVWVDSEFAETQAALDRTTPKRRWEILDWGGGGDAFLIFEGSESHPGTYCLFRPRENEIVEFMNIAPWLGDEDENASSPFSCHTADGVEITGLLTRPRHPRLKVPPLVVLCREEAIGQLSTGYQREAQALASMGFAVLQVNDRSWPFRAIRRGTETKGPDARAVADILAAMDTLAPSDADRRLTAIVGRDFGGYLALRAMQLHPDRFKCAVAIDAPTDLYALSHASRPAPMPLAMHALELSRQGIASEWSPSVSGETGFDAKPLAMTRKPSPTTAPRVRRNFTDLSDRELTELSPAAHAELVKSPVMIIEADGNTIFGGNGFAALLRKQVPDTVFLPLHIDEAAPLPRAQAALFGKIYDFLTANIYNYAVKIGAMQVVGDAPPPRGSKPDAVKPDAPLPKPNPPPPSLAPLPTLDRK